MQAARIEAVPFPALHRKSRRAGLQEDRLWPLCTKSLSYRASFFVLLGSHLNTRFQDVSSCAVQPNLSLQAPSTQKSRVKEAASSPFRKGSARSVVGLSLSVLKLSACELPECKLLRFHLSSASGGRMVCKGAGCCPAGKPQWMPMGLLDDVSC